MKKTQCTCSEGFRAACTDPTVHLWHCDIWDGPALGDEDIINAPTHYTAGGMETIDYIEAKELGFHLGNVVKYVSRAGRKGTSQLEDLEKARWYLDRHISNVRGAQ